MQRQSGATSRSKLPAALVWAVFAAFTMLSGRIAAQSDPEIQSQLTSVLQQLRPGISESQVFSAVEAHNEMRKSALRDHTARQIYEVVDLKGKVHAQEIGRMEYRAPDKKRFVVTSEAGSGLIRRAALNPLISSEIEAAVWTRAS
jgi:hypothetical protein